jgi:hypothetical protein
MSRSDFVIQSVGWLVFALLLLVFPTFAAAQDAADDAVLKLGEPDYTLVNLPTVLRLPPFKSAFRVTHRFVRPVNCDDAQRCPDNLLEDFFGVDNGALTGFEFRMGLLPNLQVGVHRARSEKTIDLFGQYAFLRQGSDVPLELSMRLGVEGTDNFRDQYSPTIAILASRQLGENGDRGALYLEPIWVGHANLFDGVGDDNSFIVAFGTRVRLSDTVYVLGEFLPRIAGYSPGTHQASFAIEKRVGGHVFQLNVSNALGTTLGQGARAAENDHDWFLGFNISRKFF